jgi:hypothetical protein
MPYQTLGLEPAEDSLTASLVSKQSLVRKTPPAAYQIQKPKVPISIAANSMRRFIPFFVVVFCLTLAGPAPAAITNGGFETGDFTGWTEFGETLFNGVDGSQPHSGAFGAFFGPQFDTGGILQDVATNPGASYELRFWLQQESGDTNSFEVRWGGTTLMSLTDSGSFPYTEFVFPVLGGPDPTTQLQFIFFNPPSFWDLDDVSVEELNVAVPEPTSLALWSLTALGAGLYSRRRRPTAA